MTAAKKFDFNSLKKNWDAETPLYRFECIIDTVAKIADGVTDDPTTQNALNFVNEALEAMHRDFSDRLI